MINPNADDPIFKSRELFINANLYRKTRVNASVLLCMPCTQGKGIHNRIQGNYEVQVIHIVLIGFDIYKHFLTYFQVKEYNVE